jgi:hypothetical protein
MVMVVLTLTVTGTAMLIIVQTVAGKCQKFVCFSTMAHVPTLVITIMVIPGGGMYVRNASNQVTQYGIVVLIDLAPNRPYFT